MEMLERVQQNSLMQQKMIVDVTEVDPICAMQACFDGFWWCQLIEMVKCQMMSSRLDIY